MWHSAGRPNGGDLHTAMAGSRNQYHYTVRRASRSVELQKAKSLFQASLAGDMDLIKEMKNAKSGCKVTTELPDNVGGAEGDQEIFEKFRQVYSSSAAGW